MNTDVVQIIKKGGVGVMATDTLYGLIGKALDRGTVERIYQIKKRRPQKPLIILISSYDDLASFDIPVNQSLVVALQQFWPGPVSIILPCPAADLEYLHRGSNTLAFRMPAKKALRQIIKQTGPLVAPSANPEGADPARNINEAKEYFGRNVDFYVSGKTAAAPSRLIQIADGKITQLRP